LRQCWDRIRLSPAEIDRVLAAMLTVGVLIDAWVGSDARSHRLAVAVVGAAVTVPVAIRRHYPTLVGTAVPAFAAVNFAIWGGPQFVGYPIANLCALYALAAWTQPRRFAVGFTVVMTTFLATSLAPGDTLPGAVPFTLAAGISVLLVRRVVGDRERRARVAERERDVAAREAVVNERARIARELHDVIAHHVSVMVMHAAAERRLIDDDRGSTREVLEAVEQTGRTALTEMRRLVEILRSDGDESRAPQPGLGDVPILVAQLQEAGLPVELRIDGAPRELPIGIQLSAYRIIQEALTNSLKHGGGAPATVDIHYRADTLELEIADDGSGSTRDTAPGGGHGLVGMRERVALYGGRLDAARRPSGGFSVRVLLPIR
jgi:signal transduction histidine kinase